MERVPSDCRVYKTGAPRAAYGNSPQKAEIRLFRVQHKVHEGGHPSLSPQEGEAVQRAAAAVALHAVAAVAAVAAPATPAELGTSVCFAVRSGVAMGLKKFLLLHVW
jgi:hypothetical protein